MVCCDKMAVTENGVQFRAGLAVRWQVPKLSVASKLLDSSRIYVELKENFNFLSPQEACLLPPKSADSVPHAVQNGGRVRTDR